MDIISNRNSKKSTNYFNSISFKIAVICFAAFFISAILSQWLISDKIKSSVIENKRNELTHLASEYLTSPASVPDGKNRRIFTLDSSLRIISDSSSVENLTGKILRLPSTVFASNGEPFFECDTSSDTVRSVYATPIFRNNAATGILVIFDNDSSQALLLDNMETTFILSSFLAFALFLILVLVLSIFLHKKIKSIVLAVNEAREKDLSEAVYPDSNDEFSPIFKEFNDLYEQLNYTQKMRQAFVSDASHELRTPLAAIKLLCESITQYDNIDTDTYREFMDDIILEVDRMSHTAQKLLILSKLDNPSASPKFAPVSLTDTVYKMISFLLPIAENKNIHIESYIEDDCIILGDMEAVNQVIGNLIDNGIKYNNPNGSLRIYLFSKGTKCVFIIDDTGIGIPAEFREEIFERFFRIDASRHHDGRGGSGLGLSIVKQNVEVMGGSISVSDSVDGGARFTVVFPSISFGKEDLEI